ncbi:hypothetical protein [Cytobacillus firmus]|nr:hypothetical protein [Cytobacillus firmus]
MKVELNLLDRLADDLEPLGAGADSYQFFIAYFSMVPMPTQEVKLHLHFL